MRLKIYEASKPELKDGEYAVPMAEKEKNRKMNKKTNRMKNFKTTRWYVTDVAPADRTFKNLPRYADKKPKCTFMQWFDLSGNPSKGCDGKWYGYSHRAVYGFAVGDLIKPGSIGNKYEYTEEVQKEYNRLYDLDYANDTKEADAYLKEIAKFEPYTIKTDKEAEEHADRFRRDVS